MDERELLIQYKRTMDVNVLGRLFSPYMSLLYGVCFKYLKDRDASQDAVMQIFEQLVEKLKIHDVDNFKSWLYFFARNHCLMELRKSKGKINVDIEQHTIESEAILKAADDVRWEEADFEKMEHCLSRLPELQATCVRLFYLKQMCYKDIGEKLNVDLNQVKSSIQNGKRNLKICMEKGNNGK
ncbi:RNA polymerase sigma factor [Sphingobacterium sp. JB170]|uniref:RNA polymerase sigma factor n=1 Tax=Sphingobacterium sp. JB170 TaxID=1434842 RepID=UPI000B352C25|nr:sigma-70 family RNA polymerase sigma factor [Sphingobacterium sp. JB170]